MLGKKRKLDLNDTSNLNFSESDLIDVVVKKIIETEICGLKKFVTGALVAKNQEISERKLAFSAVARENTEVKEENKWKTSQLEACYKAIEDKDMEIKNAFDENINKENEIIECKDTIEENNDKHNEILNKKEIEIEKLLQEKEDILIENKIKVEELIQRFATKSEQLENKIAEFDLIKVNTEAKTAELLEETNKVINLESSFLVAIHLFQWTQNSLEYKLLEGEEKSLKLEKCLFEKEKRVKMKTAQSLQNCRKKLKKTSGFIRKLMTIVLLILETKAGKSGEIL